MNTNKLNRELRTNTRTLGYALYDFASCSLAIMGIVIIYPFVWAYAKFSKKTVL